MSATGTHPCTGSPHPCPLPCTHRKSQQLISSLQAACRERASSRPGGHLQCCLCVLHVPTCPHVPTPSKRVILSQKAAWHPSFHWGFAFAWHLSVASDKNPASIWLKAERHLYISALPNDRFKRSSICSTFLYIASFAGSSKLNILPAANPAKGGLCFPQKRSSRIEAH